MPEQVMPGLPAPQIPGQQQSAPRDQGRSGFVHTPNMAHLQKEDQHRHDRSGIAALRLAVEIGKTRPQETDDAMLARAKRFRDFLKEAK